MKFKIIIQLISVSNEKIELIDITEKKMQFESDKMKKIMFFSLKRTNVDDKINKQKSQK